MVDTQLIEEGIVYPGVILAMRRVPVHRFIPDREFEGFPLSIGDDQTISQPSIVALMSESMNMQPGERYWRMEPDLGFKPPFTPNLEDWCLLLKLWNLTQTRSKAILATLGSDTVVV